MSNKKRETKDTLLGFEEEVSQTKNEKNDVEKKEKVIEESDKKEIKTNNSKEELEVKRDNSFYENEEKDSSMKSNKILYIILSIVLLIVVILSITLGLIFGINWNKDSSFVDINGDGKNDLELIEDVIESNNYETQNDVAKLKSKAIIWGFDEAHDQGFIEDSTYNLTTQNANTLAKNQVKQEKQSIQDQYADSWEKEWNDKLQSLGFDTEEEYQDSLVANTLKEELDSTFSPKSDGMDGLFVVYGKTEDIEAGISEGKYSSVYRSTIESTRGDSKALTKFGETMFYLYTKTQPLVSFNDTLIPFTFTSTFDSGLDGLMEFGSVENLRKSWELLADIASVSSSTIGTTSLIDLSSPDYSNTSSGVIDLSTMTYSSPVKFSVLYLNYIFNHINEFTTAAPTLGVISDWITPLNNLISTVNAGSGGSWNADYTLVTENDWSSLSTEQVKEISNNVSSVWATGAWSGKELIQSTGRVPLKIIELPYKHDVYNSSTNEFVELSTKADYDSLTDFGSSYGILTVSTDGFHIISPTISSTAYSTSGTTEVEQNAYKYQSTFMLLSDLNKDVDSRANVNTDRFDILDKYEIWFESISENLYLNIALGNDEFLEENNLDKESDYFQDIINYFYSDLLINQNYKKFVTVKSDIISFYDENFYIYDEWMTNDSSTSPIELAGVAGIETIYDFLGDVETLYSHFENNWNFSYNDTRTIIIEGKLS